MKDYGLVSIVMPNHDCEEFIDKAIESVLAQGYQNWEMLIQDDCSTDGSVEIAEKYAEKDARIKLQCNSENLGPAISRNNALKRARGKWIAFLDSDDLWKPEKLEKQLSFMKDNDFAFSYHEYDEIDEEGKELGVHVSGKSHVGKKGMFTCCWPGCLSVMYDAEKIGLVQINDVKKNNDTALWLKVIRKADCHLLKDNLALYRRNKKSISPERIQDKAFWIYRLFRDAEKMNPFMSSLMMILNMGGHLYKKLFYVRRY